MKHTKTPNAVTFWVRLVIHDAARRVIALERPDDLPVRKGGLARRECVQAYVQSRLDGLTAMLPHWEDRPMTAAEINDSTEAADFLRKKGWPEGQVRAWLLMQFARNAVLTRPPTAPTTKARK